jgi:hypothetical protein
LCIRPKELLSGGASHLFKNSNTQQVATEVEFKRTLSAPDISSWQAIVEVLHNASIGGTRPGFDRAVGSVNFPVKETVAK